MSKFTAEQLATLKSAYARGILEVREGDTWVKYSSLSEMRMAIQDIERELNTSNAPPRGGRLVSIRQGYR